ncbi:MAG: prepilin-type N-terminal cleavage/methylation domain-containing protein [Betaproteobacteria bacterium]|nr:MAG: prepilin-type N-terminal cleavage/methylation domain-containing protein [Betaproteobacteria bacterium]
MNASAFNRKKSNETGFTLVEIAIVLVIIGLLLGGILKGQEMITQAKIKNAINDFNGINVAVTSYQDRYRALPGDDANATTRWTTQASGRPERIQSILAASAHRRIRPGPDHGNGKRDAAAERGRGPHRRGERRGRRKRLGLHQPDRMQLEPAGQGRDCDRRADR